MSTPDISQLSQAQQEALETYTSVTDQDPITAISTLQRAEWNTQIAITRFFDGEPASDIMEEARAAHTLPPASQRQTTNLQYDFGAASSPLRSSSLAEENVVRRIDTTSSIVTAYRPPFILSFLFSPFTILFRILRSVLSPLSALLPPFMTRLFQNLFVLRPTATRRQLAPADTAQRFIREFEETYTPQTPLPWVEAGFNLTLDNCKKKGKFLLVALLSPSHDDTDEWVRKTLLSSEFHQFLQSHRQELVLWGGSVRDIEGYQVSSSLRCTKFPFMALICQQNEALSSGGIRAGEMTVIMRAAGNLRTSELTAKLESSISSQQAQLSVARAQRSEQQAQRNLRDEQDSAYERSLAQDRERARRRREEQEEQERARQAEIDRVAAGERRSKQKAAWKRWRKTNLPQDSNTTNAVRVLVRMPDGSRLARKLDPDLPLETLYAVVECANEDEVEGNDSTEVEQEDLLANYTHDYSFQLVAPMPRVVFDLSKGGTIGERIGRGGNIIVEEFERDGLNGEE